MSAESIETSPGPAPASPVIKSLGGLAIPEQGDRTATQRIVRLSNIPPELYEVGTGTRKTSMAATFMKERFQSVGTKLTADERDAQRALSRQESVRKLLKTLGMLKNDNAINEPFAQLYQDVETTVTAADKTHLFALAETYEAHPTMRVFDTLRSTSSVSEADVVLMRCTTLLLLEQAAHETGQTELA